MLCFSCGLENHCFKGGGTEGSLGFLKSFTVVVGFFFFEKSILQDLPSFSIIQCRIDSDISATVTSGVITYSEVSVHSIAALTKPYSEVRLYTYSYRQYTLECLETIFVYFITFISHFYHYGTQVHLNVFTNTCCTLYL